MSFIRCGCSFCNLLLLKRMSFDGILRKTKAMNLQGLFYHVFRKDVFFISRLMEGVMFKYSGQVINYSESCIDETIFVKPSTNE